MAFFSGISGAQYILAGLVAIITAGSFVEASGDSKCRLNFSRFLLALIAPIFWLALLLIPSWSSWIFWLDLPINEVLKLLIGIPLTVVTVTFAVIGAMVMVASIAAWVSASTTGTLRQEINAMKQDISDAMRRLITRRRSRKQ